MKLIFFLLSFLSIYQTLSAQNDRMILEDSVYRTGKKFDYYFLEALRLKENEKHSEAFSTLQYALKIDSTSSAALALLSNYYMFLQKDSLAIDALQKAVRYNPYIFDYKVSLAELYRQTGNFGESTLLFESLVAEQPSKPEFNYFLSDLYLKQNQISKAIQSLDALENTIGVNEALSMQKYNLYLAVGQEKNAIDELEKLSSINQMETKYQIMIGDYYLEKNNLNKALTYYDKAKKIDPQSPHYIISITNYYEKTGDKDAAMKEIESALINLQLDIESKISILGRYIGNLLSNNKEISSVNSLFNTLMEQHSQEKELNLMYGQFLISQEKYEEASFQFKLVTEADPENLLAWRLLMEIAVKEEVYDEVIRICSAAIEVFPSNPEFYFYKGNAYYQNKKFLEALNAFQEGVKFAPKDNLSSLSMFYGQIGDLYYHLNKKNESYNAYEKALEYNDNNIYVLNNYAYFLSLDKVQLDKAERMIAKCIRLQPNNSTYIDTYAWVFFQKGNYSLAKFYIESAISYGGETSPDILEHYGDILFKTGNIEKAVEQWEKALKIKEEGAEPSLLIKKIENKTYYETL